MEQTNTIRQLWVWFKQCPFIDKKNKFLVDNLGGEPVEYAIFTTPSTLEYKNYLGGQTVLAPEQTLNFVFASQNNYSMSVLENLANTGFFDNVSQWLYEQTQARNFPEITEGKVKSILASNTSYVMIAGESSAKYQIQCKLKYRRYD